MADGSNPVTLGGGRSAYLLKADLLACRRALNNGSRSFLAASMLLPTQMRSAATALYAFCREADDLIDQGEDQATALGIVDERITRIYAENPEDNFADRALAAVVHHYAIPKPLLDALVEGFAWDAAGRRYRSENDIYAYSARVAGTVGAMMALLMGARQANTIARACDLGVAMQLTNICRDVGEDARAGRLYLPETWLREAGVEPNDWLHRPIFDARIKAVVARLLDAAETLYHRADAGIAMLPSSYRPGMRAARYLYAAIGAQIDRQGGNSVDRRAVVNPKIKIKLLVKALTPHATVIDETNANSPALPETQFLVDAVTHSPATMHQIDIDHRAGLMRRPNTTRKQVHGVIEIFERLEVRQRELQAAGRVPYWQSSTTTSKS